MITGIDETGDFDPNSNYKQFFVAVNVDQNSGKNLIKEKQFREWESTIPEGNREEKSGEIKGVKLLPNQIDEFFYEVLIKPPRSYFTAVEFNPLENSKELVEKHKQWNLSQMQNAMLQRKNAGQQNWTKRYIELISWYGKSNYQRVVKIECLQNLYSLSFQQAFFYSQLLFSLDNLDDSNFKFRFKIDKDFVRSTLLRNFWDIYFHKFWQTFVLTNGTPLLDKNPQLMEALKKHFKIENDNLILQETFYEHTTFVDSKEHFEVRLADIFGNILHRYHNKGQCEKIWNFIVQIVKSEKTVPLYSVAKFKRGDPPLTVQC